MITHEIARDMVINNIIEWFREELLAYISQQEQFAKDVARYFHVIEVFDKYKRENPDKTDEEIRAVLKDEVNAYRELKEKLRKVGKKE